MVANDSKEPVFHVAVAAHDLAEARAFYVDRLGCGERTGAAADAATAAYAVLDFFGCQLVVIEAPAAAENAAPAPFGEPLEHFGVILHWEDWEDAAERCESAGVPFAVAPNVTDHDGLGEVGSFFVRDPSGNALEFKAYRDRTKIL